jgi:hypothetical protein
MKHVVKLPGRRGWTIVEDSRSGSGYTCQSRGRGLGTGHTMDAAIVGAGYDDGIGPVTYRTKRAAEDEAGSTC